MQLSSSAEAMTPQLRAARAREEFLMIRNSYLTSARPIQTPEHLKGRTSALQSLIDALTSPGRHAFIYGYRGVGKSSLAQTTAFLLQSSMSSPILVACEPTSTFANVCRDIIQIALNVPALETKEARKISVGANVAGYGGNLGYETNPNRQQIEISSVNDAIALLRQACAHFGPGFIVVVDEFDQLSSAEEHQKFALLLKQISDQRIPVRFTFCGIAESIDRLFSQHESIFRQIHSVLVERLDLQSCIDIIQDASKALKIEIRDDFTYRVAQVSDGFPSFVHLISEKIFTAAFDLDGSKVTQASYERGILEAVGSVELSLKRSYEAALHRNTHKYEHVIWAVAYDKLLEVNIDIIWRHYNTICEHLQITPVTRANVSSKLGQLTTEQYGKLLEKPRRSNYTFTERMTRAYARLRAEKSGCLLGPENPAFARRLPNGSSQLP
jgi:hypothetical protein